MSLFARRATGPDEARSISFQDVWGSGLDVDDNWDGDAIALAMQIPIVQKCIGLISDSVGLLPRKVYRRADPDSPPERVNPLPSLIAEPSALFDWETWVRLAVFDLITDHNAFGIKRDTRSGWPTGIEWMPAREVTVWGVYPNAMYGWRGQTFRPSEVVHIRRRGAAGLLRDPSPLHQVAREVRLAVEIQRYGHGFFANGATPSSVLTSDQILDEDTARTIKRRFIAAVGKRREPAVLGAGLSWQQVSTAPNESQHLETKAVLDGEFAHLFGVPPECVGGKSGGSLTYANLEMLQTRILAEAVQPVVTLLERALSNQLPRAQYLRLDTDALVRVDLKTRMETDRLALQSGMASVDERRRLHDQPPLPDGQGEQFLWPPMATTPPAPEGKPQ